MSIFGNDPHFERMAEALSKLPTRAGLDKGMLEAGDVLTFSRNKVNGDRSYTRGVWKVVAQNGFQMKLEWVGGEKPYGDPEIILLMDEHEFYDGRALIARGNPA